MDLTKLITVCILYAIFGVALVLTLPIFDNEFVHIKVYIADEAANTNQIKSKHPLRKHHAPKDHVIYKSNYHYRPHRMPIKSLHSRQTAPVLESFFLAELDKHHNHDNLHPKFMEETFLVKEQLYNSKENEDINSLKTAKDFKNLNKHPINIDHHHKRLRPYIETPKFVELKPHYNYQQQEHVEYDYQIPEEVIKVIEAPSHTTFANDNYNYGDVPKVNEGTEKNFNCLDCNNFQIRNRYQQPIAKEISKSQAEYDLYQHGLQTKQHHSQTPNISIKDNSETEPLIATEIPMHSNVKPCITNSTVKEDNPKNKYQTQLNVIESQNNHFFNTVENPYATETYMGYDSYNAAHVQGLGSGYYRHHMLS